MTAMLLFVSTLALVFALGLQSQFINNGHYWGAFANSAVISLGQIGAFQVVHAHTGWDYAAYMLGGPIGVVASMYCYRKKWKK